MDEADREAAPAQHRCEALARPQPLTWPLRAAVTIAACLALLALEWVPPWFGLWR